MPLWKKHGTEPQRQNHRDPAPVGGRKRALASALEAIALFWAEKKAARPSEMVDVLLIFEKKK